MLKIVFYRVLSSIPAVRRDFESQKKRGQPLRRQTPQAVRLWDGLSVYKTEEQARQIAAGAPHIGNFIAELHIPADADAVVQFDSGRNGHCTVWGDPDHLRAFVHSVVQV